jgi:fibronectin-binding autotransporter adhesin
MASIQGGGLTFNYSTFLRRELNLADLTSVANAKTNLNLNGSLAFGNGLISSGTFDLSSAQSIAVNATTLGGASMIPQYTSNGDLYVCSSNIKTLYTCNLHVNGAITGGTALTGGVTADTITTGGLRVTGSITGGTTLTGGLTADNIIITSGNTGISFGNQSLTLDTGVGAAQNIILSTSTGGVKIISLTGAATLFGSTYAKMQNLLSSAAVTVDTGITMSGGTTGTTVSNGLTTNTLSCTGTSTLTGAVSMPGGATAQTLGCSSTSTFTGLATFNGGTTSTASTVNGTLSATTMICTTTSQFNGLISANQGISGTTSSFQSQTLSGALTANGGATVSGGLTTNTLSCTGTSTFTGYATFNGGILNTGNPQYGFQVTIGVNCPISAGVTLPFSTAGNTPTPGLFNVSNSFVSLNMFSLQTASLTANALTIPQSGVYLVSMQPRGLSSDATFYKNGTAFIAITLPFSIPLYYASGDTFAYSLSTMPTAGNGFYFSIVKL